MKTKGLGKLVILGLILTSLVSCKEEEFYEKEFIDTLSDQYERENLPDDVAESPWEAPTDNTGVTNGGSNDDGGSTGGGSNDDGGSTGGGSNDDGGSTGGGSNDDGGSTGGGSNDDGGSTGGGSNDDGNDDGDYDDGSDDSDDSDDNSTTPPVELEAVSDSFNQNENGTKLDILWVIDNSGSMSDEQRALGENFDAFIKEFVNKDIDFQMAVTTTDTRGSNAGKVYKDSMDRLTSDNLKADKEQFLKDFAKLVKVGTRGSGYEKGIQASEVFADRYANNWMRSDAYLTIVYMSDEEDQSSKDVPKHLKQIQKWKTNSGLVKAFSIVDMVDTNKRGAISRGYARYKEISELTGGKVASIKGDFHATLLEMGEQIADLTEQFPLSKVPYDVNNLEVYVDDVLNPSWSYDSTSNSIKFDVNSIPAAGAKIEVRYNIEK